MSAYYYGRYRASIDISNTSLFAVEAAMGLLLPLLGWSADVRFGRYKVVSYSLCTMWISSVLLTGTMVATELTDFKHHSVLTMMLLVVLGVTYGGYQANIIQFGIDQLIDASTSEHKSFIAWYSWTFLSSGLVVYYVHKCVQYKLLAPMLVCCQLTLAIVLHIAFKHVLIKEPASNNPFKLIYKVIKYAIKHKHPRLRSAFTYCEDTIPSRIDFGKSKYGGPFTTEQVEDVKTALRVIAALAIGCTVYCVSDDEHFVAVKAFKLFTMDDSHHSMLECSSKFAIDGQYYICGTILIPLHELIINPLFHKCLPNLNSYSKAVVGSLFRSAQIILHLILVTISRHQYYSTMDGKASINATIQCLFHEPNGFLNNYIDHRWTALSSILTASSDLLIYIGTLEFLCAQVPYSMKGLATGIMYAFLGLYLSLFNAVEAVYTNKSILWSTGIISCGFWYLLTKLCLQLTATAILLVAIKCYKKRKREDVLPNEQIFAERYYSS